MFAMFIFIFGLIIYLLSNHPSVYNYIKDSCLCTPECETGTRKEKSMQQSVKTLCVNDKLVDCHKYLFVYFQ